MNGKIHIVVKRKFSIFYDGCAVRFYCDLRDSWQNLRDHFGPSTYIENTVIPQNT